MRGNFHITAGPPQGWDHRILRNTQYGIHLDGQTTHLLQYCTVLYYV